MSEPVATKPLPPATPSRPLAVALEVIEGPDTGRRFGELPERCSVGSHPSNAVVLDDAAVSRFHCELIVERDAIRIVDRASLNGTRVNGVEVERAVVREPARLQLGATVLRVSLGALPCARPAEGAAQFGSLVGAAPAMRALFRTLELAAASDATVLLEGETGTGKEGAAEGIHAASRRADGPFVAIDCSAIPGALLESLLFGHEAGSFTGATGTRRGAFEEAHGGTLFLDEIGELPLDQQPKLLRALEAREIRRVGGAKPIAIDARVIAATHRDLRGDVNHGRFRPDLFYRLAVVPIALPPLRDRTDDLPLLVGAVLDRLGARPEVRPILEDPAFLAALARWPWPGNVRELRNHVERCVVFQEARLPAAPAAAPPSEPEPYDAARRRALEAFERGYVTDLLARTNDSVAAAAKLARIHRGYLYRLIDRYRLRR